MIEILKIIVGKRWLLIVTIFALEIAVILVVSNSAFFPSEMAAYEKQYNSTAAVLNQSAAGQVAGIFANNFRVAVVEIIPVLGVMILGLSLYETARIVEVIGIIKGYPVAAALANLFFLPSTWLELPAYAIAAAESIYLAYSIYLGFRDGWGRFVRELRFLIVNVVLIAGVLIVAATFEVTEIQLETAFPATAPIWEQLLVFVTWIPFIFVAWGVVRFWKTARREAPAIEERDAAEMAQLEGPQGIGGQIPSQPEGDEGATGGPTSGEGGTTA